jgi:hypothetical protein
MARCHVSEPPRPRATRWIGTYSAPHEHESTWNPRARGDPSTHRTPPRARGPHPNPAYHTILRTPPLIQPRSSSHASSTHQATCQATTLRVHGFTSAIRPRYTTCSLRKASPKKCVQLGARGRKPLVLPWYSPTTYVPCRMRISSYDGVGTYDAPRSSTELPLVWYTAAAGKKVRPAGSALHTTTAAEDFVTFRAARVRVLPHRQSVSSRTSPLSKVGGLLNNVCVLQGPQ